jgi:hypothetical protein
LTKPSEGIVAVTGKWVVAQCRRLPGDQDDRGCT